MNVQDMDLRGWDKRYVARKLSSHAKRIRAFMELACQELPGSPTFPNAKIRALRVRLIMEEVLEFARASGVHIKLTVDADGTPPLEFNDLVFETTDAVDLVEVADGLADISVVTTGAMLAYGIADEGLLKEVDRSNLAKFGPGGYKDEHGKWRKPSDHQPPRIADVLRDQGWCPPTAEEGGDHEDDQVPVSSDGDERAG